jgi:hypothetical protein
VSGKYVPAILCDGECDQQIARPETLERFAEGTALSYALQKGWIAVREETGEVVDHAGLHRTRPSDFFRYPWKHYCPHHADEYRKSPVAGEKED